MKRHEFEQRVRATGRHLDPRLLAVAENTMLKKRGGEPYQADVREAIELAARLQDELKQDRRSDPVPATRLIAERLIRAVEPDVRNHRRELFGSERPPFRSRRQAQQWLERELRRNDTPRPSPEVALAASRQVWPARVVLTDPAVVYYDGGGRPLTLGTAPAGSPLAKVVGRIERLAGQTGLPQAGLLDYLLRGKIPTLPTWTLRYHLGSPASILRATITVNYLDLRQQDLVAALDAAQDALWQLSGEPKTKSITEADLTLWRVVMEEGGVPDSKKTTFWQRVAKRCGLAKWNAARMRWSRLEPRLRRLGLGGDFFTSDGSRDGRATG